MTLFRTVNGVIAWFDNTGAPINPDGSPRPGPTLDALGGPDGTEPPGFDNPGATPTPPPAPSTSPSPAPSPSPPPVPQPPPPGGLATLYVQVTDATTGAALAGATVLSSSDYGGQQTHVTNDAGVAALVAGVGFLVEVNVIAAGYVNNDHVVSITDTSDHWYAVALARAGAGTGDGDGSKQPPGVPPVIVIRPGEIGPLSDVVSHVYDLPPAPGYTRATFETRAGVPSITGASFSALDVPGFGLSPSGIISSIIGGLIGLFKGSSGSAEINRLSGIVQNMGQYVLQLASTLADYTARAVHSDRQGGSLFDHILGGVLGPIINALAAVIRGGSSDLGKLFGPITDSIKKLVGAVRRIYDTWLRPILKAIDTTRQILRVLEAFHLKWATEADAALGRLEGKLSAPLLETIRQLNRVSNVVNRIVTLDGALQRVTLLQSIVKHRTCVQRAIAAAPMAAPGTYAQKLAPVDVAAGSAQLRSDFDELLDNDSGPMAEQLEAMDSAFDQGLTA